MASTESHGAPARVVVRIASASECEATIAVAADLARALGSEIVGLFVEEEGWFAASSLPFPAMMSHGGKLFDTTPERVAAAMQREAETVRRLVARTAERVRLSWSFRAERGDWRSRLGATVGPEDIVVLRHDVLTGVSAGLVDLALKLAPKHGGVLLLPSHLRLERREAIVLGTGSASRRLTVAARHLAESLGVTVVEADPGSWANTLDVRQRIDRAWLVIAALDRLGDRGSWEARLLSGRFRTPLLLLRDGGG